MAYGDLHSANINAQRAPENCHGHDLKPNDQCAMAIRLQRKFEYRGRMREDRLSNIGQGGLMARPFDDMKYWDRREMENRYLERQDKRGTRGGMTMRPEDGLANPPRGHYAATFRDMLTPPFKDK